MAEAYDSRIADDRRRDIASDLDNLTIADPTVNRSQKSDRDAAEWMPARHGAWFAERVIAVKLEYGLSVDPAERAALEALLSGGGAALNCVDADTTSPTVVINSDASAPVTGPFPIAIAFSEPVIGFELEDLVVGNGSASELQGTNASYTATITPEASGTVTVDIAAGVAQDSTGNPSVAADQFSIVADLTSVPMNRSPAPAGTLPNRTMGPDDTLNVDLSQAFVDPDDDAMTYTVSSSAPQVVRASVTGALVILAAGSEGAATIRVTATDPHGWFRQPSRRVTADGCSSRAGRLLAPVLFLAHGAEPGGRPAVAAAEDGELHDVLVGRRAVPVHEARRREDRTPAGHHLDDLPVARLRPAPALLGSQDLPAGMAVPVRADPGLEAQPKRSHVGRVRPARLAADEVALGSRVRRWLAEREAHERARRHDGKQDAHTGLSLSLHVDSPSLAYPASGWAYPLTIPAQARLRLEMAPKKGPLWPREMGPPSTPSKHQILGPPG